MALALTGSAAEDQEVLRGTSISRPGWHADWIRWRGQRRRGRVAHTDPPGRRCVGCAPTATVTAEVTARTQVVSTWPHPRVIRHRGQAPMRESLRVTPFNEAINDMPRADLDAPKKQCGTALRVLATLVDEVQASAISLKP